MFVGNAVGEGTTKKDTALLDKISCHYESMDMHVAKHKYCF